LNDSFPYRIHITPDMESSNFLVSWSEDAGRLGPGVTDYLIEKLNCRLFCEIEPLGFFPMSGVEVENDVAQFPASSFYFSQEKKIVILKSQPPLFDWHSFLNIILDIAERICNVNEIYTIGGMISVSSHTAPRGLMATMNSSIPKEILGNYDMDITMNYETPLGQKPTMSSYLLWAARQRNITGISLWVPIPFYLTTTMDYRANQKVIDFVNRRFMLGIDASDARELAIEQNSILNEAVKQDPEIREIVSRLENNSTVTEEDGQKLLKAVHRYLHKNSGE
jgi:predicted ATP-grasp superfamily ATP-dependent carboligase